MKDNVNCIVIAGVPGVGKTTIAIVAGYKLSPYAQVIKMSLMGIDQMDALFEKVVYGTGVERFR